MERQNALVAQPPEHSGQGTAISGKLIPWKVCTVTTDGRVLANA